VAVVAATLALLSLPASSFPSEGGGTDAVEKSGAPLHLILVAEETTGASDKAADKDKEKDGDSLPMPPTPVVELSPAEQYCSNVLDATAAAQIARQTSALEKTRTDIDGRIALLAAKTEELKGWIKKREDFTARATESLVQIYGKMKPDAAAGQLTAMDELVAAAIMSRLSPKTSSLIMAEMNAAKGARLSAVIAGAGEIAMKPEPIANAQQ
jgi:flagellar motility protein MotE (MotC chaperone)